MEFTLHPSSIDCYDKVFSQTLRKEETQDAVVPDTLPDIGEILSTSGDLLIRSKDVGEGRARIEANVPARVAYVPENGEGACCLEVNVPLYVSVEDESIPEGGVCTAEMSLAVLETKVLNPRKVCVRAEAVFTVDCWAEGQMAFAGAPEEDAEGVHVLERSVTVTPVCTVTEKTFVLTDEFTIPDTMPPAATILSQQTQVQADDVKTVGTKIVVKGSAKSSLLYVSEEMVPGAVEFTTEFSQVIEAETMPEEPFVSVSILPSGTYYDLSGGDGRTGEMELHLVAQATVCGEKEAECLTDAYSNRCALEMETETMEITRVRKPLILRETLRDQIPTAEAAAEILQGCYRLGSARAEGGTVTLPVTVCVHYKTAEGRLCAAKKNFTVEFRCELEEGQRLAPAGVSAESLSLAPAAGGIEARLPLEARVFVQETEAVQRVTAITADEDAPIDLSGRPSLVLLKVRSGDDLWALAKANASTVRAITEANGLDSLTAPWEKLILIPKTI